MTIINKLYKRGDIFWANLGKGEGSEQSGLRPVVIIQNNKGNKFSPTVIVSAITSQINKAKIPTHIQLESNKYPRLNKSSFILLEQVRTIDKRRLGDYICSLDEADTIKLNRALDVSVQEVTSDVLQRLYDLQKNISELDIFIKGWIRKGSPVYELQDEFLLRHSYLCEMKAICKDNNIDCNEFYNEFEMNNILKNIAEGGKSVVGMVV